MVKILERLFVLRFWRNAKVQSIRSGVFLLWRGGSLHPAIIPWCYVIIAQRRGDRLMSPPSSFQHREFHINGKGILPSLFA
ncbi:MAG: hypothetical protein LUQ36_01595 [Methanoregula sp.]|nr:hypothetical protein [Methanoregula sp.]